MRRELLNLRLNFGYLAQRQAINLKARSLQRRIKFKRDLRRLRYEKGAGNLSRHPSALAQFFDLRGDYSVYVRYDLLDRALAVYAVKYARVAVKFTDILDRL